jgi:hypothetical protein
MDWTNNFANRKRKALGPATPVVNNSNAYPVVAGPVFRKQGIVSVLARNFVAPSASVVTAGAPSLAEASIHVKHNEFIAPGRAKTFADPLDFLASVAMAAAPGLVDCINEFSAYEKNNEVVAPVRAQTFAAPLASVVTDAAPGISGATIHAKNEFVAPVRAKTFTAPPASVATNAASGKAGATIHVKHNEFIAPAPVRAKTFTAPPASVVTAAAMGKAGSTIYVGHNEFVAPVSVRGKTFADPPASDLKADSSGDSGCAGTTSVKRKYSASVKGAKSSVKQQESVAREKKKKSQRSQLSQLIGW